MRSEKMDTVKVECGLPRPTSKIRWETERIKVFEILRLGLI